jgi:hypothetical protein
MNRCLKFAVDGFALTLHGLFLQQGLNEELRKSIQACNKFYTYIKNLHLSIFSYYENNNLQCMTMVLI